MKRQQKGRGPAAAQNTVVDLRLGKPRKLWQRRPLRPKRLNSRVMLSGWRITKWPEAFASALRQANARRPVLTGEALKLSQKLAQFQQLVKEDQARVQSLTQSVARHPKP